MSTSAFDWNQIVTALVTTVPVAVGFVWAIKSDTKVLKVRLDTVDSKLDKMDGVLVGLAETKGRQDLSDERQLMAGKRLDELATRFNEWVDSRDPTRCPAKR